MAHLVNRNVYGAQEVGGLLDGGAYHKAHHENHAGLVDWRDPRLARVTRLRLLSDPGYPEWDVSYCHGVLKDGRNCDVQVPFSSLPRRLYQRVIVQYAIKDGVHAKKLGVLDNISTLV